MPYKELPSIDKYILGRFSEVVAEVTAAYDNFQFFRASQALLRFTSNDLSSFYLDIAKDRLYISAADDARRRSCQTVFRVIVEGLAKMMAPILPHMAEDIWLNLPYQPPSASVFKGGWTTANYPQHQVEKWSRISALRSDVNKAMELARGQKLVGSSLECQVRIHTDDDAMRAILQETIGDTDLRWPSERTNSVDDLRCILIASQIVLADSSADAADGTVGCAVEAATSESGCTVGIVRATGMKCERCWM